MNLLSTLLHNLIAAVLWVVIPICILLSDFWRWYTHLPFPKFVGWGVVIIIGFNILIYPLYLGPIPHLMLCAAAGLTLGLGYTPRDEQNDNDEETPRWRR